MINLTLFKKEWKSNKSLLFIILAVLTIYGVMVIALYNPEVGDSLRAMSAVIPQIFAAFGMADVGTTLLEFISGYLYGFLFIVFPCVFFILLSNRLIARYVENGSMVYLLSGPHKRWKIALTQAVFLVCCLLLLVGYLVLLILTASHIMFPSELETIPFLAVNAGLLGLLLFFGGSCFLFSCWFSESRLALGAGAAVTVYSVLIHMISQMGTTFQSLRRLTPITLFDADGLAALKGSAFFSCAVLYLAGILFLLLGILRFEKKDLSI